MQDRPDKATLLLALARFLLSDVQPRVAAADRGLGFRVLIAANLAQIVAAEVRGEEQQDAAQLGRLLALLPDLAPAARGEARSAGGGAPPVVERTSERQRLIQTLEGELLERLRAGRLDPAGRQAAWAHAEETLREKLRVNNPRFVLSSDIEGGEGGL